jgi:hypothetical protein
MSILLLSFQFFKHISTLEISRDRIFVALRHFPRLPLLFRSLSFEVYQSHRQPPHTDLHPTGLPSLSTNCP